MARQPLSAHGLHKAYGDRVVLDGIDLVASPGQRVGLVGENGVGKSTLLRLLAGVEPPDDGTVSAPADLAYLPQEPAFAGDDTVADVLARALAPLHHAVREVERLGTALAAAGDDPHAGQQYADALQWAQDHAAWDAGRRAEVAAYRLGVDDLAANRPVSRLSGGQRSRLAMAAIITRRPDCVLLDEPTNHLDDDAMRMLEDFTRGLPGVVVAATHDRTFLDAVCSNVVDLDPAMGPLGTTTGPTRYGGGFSDYLGAKAAARRRWEETYTTQQAQLGILRAATWVDTLAIAHDRGPRDNDKYIYGFKGANVERARARRVHDAERRLTVAEREQVRKPPAVLRLDGGPLTGLPGRSGLAVSVRGLRVPGRLAVDTLDVPTGGRLLVTGANGSGKSTLLAVLDATLRPSEGSVQVSARRVGTLAQDVTFVDAQRTARDTYADALGVDGAERRPIGDLGLLHPRDLGRPVGVLSVGQRRRLGLAIVLARSPDLLLLDEPTNHISLALATELEDAITRPGSSSGTIVVASHDRWLRRRWDGPRIHLSPVPPAAPSFP